MAPNTTKPNILVIAGHDPCGGAGIHADIEAIQALGGHCATLITGLTVQNTQNVFGFDMVPAHLFQQQADALLDDMTFDAVKIGMTGNVAHITIIASVLDALRVNNPHLPVVLDPVLAAEAGGALSGESVPEAINRLLMPRSQLATPNLPEAQQLAKQQDLGDCARALLTHGAEHVLITGTHADTEHVTNHLFHSAGRHEWHWPRLPYQYHGSGCTLASACAALLAHGIPITDALTQAQAYVHLALSKAWKCGKGQHVPRREKIDTHHDD